MVDDLGRSFLTIEWFAGIGGMSRGLERLGLRTSQTVMCEQDENCLSLLRQYLPRTIVWKDICLVDEKMVREAFDSFPNPQGVIQSGGSPCQGLSLLSSQRLHFEDGRSALFFDMVRVIKLVVNEAKRRRMWHYGFAENVICDPEDQAVFRKETTWSQWLICSGGMSTVRRPRFLWVSEDLDESILVEKGHNYSVGRLLGPWEDPDLWPLPGWRWGGRIVEALIPTFIRSIPRRKPPASPAGLSQTDELHTRKIV